MSNPITLDELSRALAAHALIVSSIVSGTREETPEKLEELAQFIKGLAEQPVEPMSDCDDDYEESKISQRIRRSQAARPYILAAFAFVVVFMGALWWVLQTSHT